MRRTLQWVDRGNLCLSEVIEIVSDMPHEWSSTAHSGCRRYTSSAKAAGSICESVRRKNPVAVTRFRSPHSDAAASTNDVRPLGELDGYLKHLGTAQGIVESVADILVRLAARRVTGTDYTNKAMCRCILTLLRSQTRDGSVGWGGDTLASFLL